MPVCYGALDLFLYAFADRCSSVRMVIKVLISPIAKATAHCRNQLFAAERFICRMSSVTVRLFRQLFWRLDHYAYF